MKRLLTTLVAVTLLLTGVLAYHQYRATAADAAKAPIELKVTDIAGKKLDLSTYRGKVVVVDVWATWCPYCVEEIPEVLKFNQAMTDGKKPVQLVGLSLDHSAAPVKEFVAKHAMTYPVAVVNKAQVKLFGDVPGIPVKFILNDKGQVVDTIVGGTTAEAITKAVTPYLPK